MSIDDNDTVIQVGSGLGALFPSPGASEYFLVTLEDASGNIEICRCTSRSSDLLTVTRAQESTTAQAWTASAARVELRTTRGTFERFLQLDSGVVASNIQFTGTIQLPSSTTINGSTPWTAGNDGSSSGLDADLLDGQHGSYYRDAGNMNAGTLPDARFPATLPAASGANLTNLDATDLTGNIAYARFSVNLLANDGAGSTLDADLLDGVQGIAYRDVPRRTSTFTRGECIAISAGVTLNTSDMAAGYTFSLYNDSGSSVTITQGSGVTMRLAGSSTTGSRTLAARGLATIWCNSGTEAIVTGAGVT